jgi:hypothetical protein
VCMRERGLGGINQPIGNANNDDKIILSKLTELSNCNFISK